MTQKFTAFTTLIGFEFEKFCSEVFQFLGYRVNQKEDTYNNGIDMVISTDEGRQLAVSVKFYRTRIPSKSMLIKAINQIKEASHKCEIKEQILVIGLPLPWGLKEELSREYHIQILDYQNLLYLIKSNTYLIDLFDNIMKDIPSDLQTEKYAEEVRVGELSFKGYPHQPISEPRTTHKYINKIGEQLWKDLQKIRSGNSSFAKYERKCEEILKYLFEENLNGWIKQLRTDDGLNRYDLVCRVLKGNDFWELLINQFHSRYIVFEFKNYSKPVKQTQVYTTEKYLFQKALRNVSFMISRHGLDDNAMAATKGILRETGKLIINLKDEDLLRLLELKDIGSEPSDYLFDLLDDYLMRLSK